MEAGDVIDVAMHVPDVGVISGTFTITCYDPNTATIHTCGHCFPSNARASGLRLMKTSGFDTPTEGVEHAALRALDPRRFSPHVDGRPLRIPSSVSIAPAAVVWLRRGRAWLQGTVLAVLTRRLRPSRRVGRWRPVAPLDLSPPIVLVRGSLQCDRAIACLGTRHGWSGAPWMLRDGGDCELVGAHVARVELRDGEEVLEVSAARPLCRRRDGEVAPCRRA